MSSRKAVASFRTSIDTLLALGRGYNITGGQLQPALFSIQPTAKAGCQFLANRQPDLHRSPVKVGQLLGRGGRLYSSRSTGSPPTGKSGSSVTPSRPSVNRPQRPSILQPVAFCALTSVAAFSIAAISEERKYRKDWQRFKEQPLLGIQARDEAPEWLAGMPRLVRNLYREFWLDVPPAQRAVTLIVAANLAVYGAFRFLPPMFRGFLERNFIHHLPPYPNRVLTLLTSNFCHLSLLHLGFNMLAFLSFGKEAARLFGFGQFLAFYVSAGLASGLASHLSRIWSLRGGASIGASGAVYACFAATALTQPDTEVVLIFLPMLPIKIGDALNVTIALDILGVILGWRRFDHYGHLGGALFGLFYTLKGQQLIWPRFQKLAEELEDRSSGGEY